ncbi:phosphotransferase [Kitasatospora sp. NPDC059722]|uniref:phosphotransferase n=1 Tax=unclassified Kitasatospora TaxID=2633591 RepID=UPI0036697562
MTDDQREVELAGGGVNRVFRAGATVRRPSGPWTATVHALLDHVHRRGFAGAPRAHGLDPQGREVLDFIPGDVGHRPLTDDALVAVGALLREFHDATADFTPPPDATWFLPAREPAEVVCHGAYLTAALRP